MTRDWRWLRAGAAAVALAGIAGCGSTAALTTTPRHSQAPAATATPKAHKISVKPCSLVTKAEADALAGLTLEDGQEYAESCSYNAPTTGPSGQVFIGIADGAHSFYNVEVNLGAKFEPIPNDDADDALWEVDHATEFLRDGDFWVALSLPFGDAVQSKPPMEQLAATIASRLRDAGA